MTAPRQDTRGPQRRLYCSHMPTGTVAWPLHYPTAGPHASVYSCRDSKCVVVAAAWVRDCTGQFGVYRDFALLGAS